MVNEMIIPGFVFLSRLALIVHGLSAGNVSNTTTAKAPVKCLQILDDARIHDSLKSEQNCYNISRAIYPPADVPSLYVKITVKFLSGPANGSGTTVKDTRHYTWSKACLYVATKHVSLYAINVYSLGAIWPNKREKELSISLPVFCNNTTEEERKSKMLYFLSTVSVFKTQSTLAANTDTLFFFLTCTYLICTVFIIYLSIYIHVYMCYM